MAHQRRFPPRAVAWHRPRPVERDVLAGCRHARLARARREHAAKPRAGMAQEVVHARSGAGQQDARRIGLAKKDADGFRVRTDNGERLRIQVIAIAAFLPYPKLSRDGRRPVAQDRHPGRCQGDGARARLRQVIQQRASDVRLEQWRDRAAVPVSHLGRAGRSRRGVRARLCGVVRVRRQAGHQAGRSEHPEDLRSLHRGRRPEGRGPQPATRRRSGRSWSISNTASARSASRRRAWACGWCRTGWAISPRGCATRSIAARRAIRIRRPGTSRHDVCDRGQCKALPLPLREGVGGRGPWTTKRPRPPTPSRKGRGSLSSSADADLPRPPPGAGGDHHLRDHAGDLRHPSPAAGGFRHRLRRAGGCLGHGDLGRRGGRHAPRLRPEPAALGAVLEVARAWWRAAISAARSNTGGR